jgi:hypothetical protein
MSNIRGFVLVSNSTSSKYVQKEIKSIIEGKVLPCIEINKHGCLAYVSDVNQITMIDPPDIVKSFECQMVSGYVLPKTDKPEDALLHLASAIRASKGNSITFNSSVVSMSLIHGRYYTEILTSNV